jgi:hypothetical protein
MGVVGRDVIGTPGLAGDTPILMGDGRSGQLADLLVDAAIYGSVRAGRWRRHLTTRVITHRSAVEPAYSITLTDGTELRAGGDHRLLTYRGWKFVTGSEQGRFRRPHLTLNDTLIGTGRFAVPAEHSAEYRRGYLCGLIRGDGYVGSYPAKRVNGSIETRHSFRLALIDSEALQRATRYLLGLGVVTKEYDFKLPSGNSKPMRAIWTSVRANVERVKELVQWPREASADWRKGFLAGIFDAEGSHGSVIRITNTDSAIIEMTAACLQSFGFDLVIEDPRRPNRCRDVRIRGGLRENLRFFHTVDPAIGRKRGIAGSAVRSSIRLGVVAIEPLHVDLRLFAITTGTGDFIANGVVSGGDRARGAG